MATHYLDGARKVNFKHDHDVNDEIRQNQNKMKRKRVNQSRPGQLTFIAIGIATLSPPSLSLAH